MIRGRHRGLPVAIDRSILLPSDLEALHGPPIDQIDTNASEVRSDDGSGFPSLDKGVSRVSGVRQRSRTGTTSTRRFSGGQPARRMQSSASAASNTRKGTSGPNPAIQFAPAPTVPVKRPTPTRPTLNGYLSTIYSEGPTPAGTPNNEKNEKAASKEDVISSDNVIATASTSSGDTSGKDAITLAEKSVEK